MTTKRVNGPTDPESAPSSPTQDAQDAVDGKRTDAVEPQAQQPGQGRTFGKLSPSEAARLRWERVRQDEALREQGIDPDDVRYTRVPVRVGAIIKALEKEAKTGDASAARELRAWLLEYPPSDGSFSAAELAKDARREIYARLAAELVAEGVLSEADLPASVQV